MRHVYNDGGPQARWLQGHAGDCVAWPSPSPLAVARKGKVASVGFLGRGRPGPVATPARNIFISGCIYEQFSQFREVLALICSKLDAYNFRAIKSREGKYDKEANLGLNPTLDATR